MRHRVISEHDEQITRCNRPGRKQFTPKKLCFFLVPALVILTAIFFFTLNEYHTTDFNKILTRAQIAKLPESIKNLKVDTRPVMSKGRPVPYLYYLFVKFQAEPNDINRFLVSSPSIDVNSFRPLVPLIDCEDVPTWWPTNLSTSGRMYISLEQKDTYGGSVFVYDDSNTVRIVVCYIANPEIRDAQLFLENLKDNSEHFVGDLIHEVSDILGN